MASKLITLALVVIGTLAALIGYDLLLAGVINPDPPPQVISTPQPSSSTSPTTDTPAVASSGNVRMSCSNGTCLFVDTATGACWVVEWQSAGRGQANADCEIANWPERQQAPN